MINLTLRHLLTRFSDESRMVVRYAFTAPNECSTLDTKVGDFPWSHRNLLDTPVSRINTTITYEVIGDGVFPSAALEIDLMGGSKKHGTPVEREGACSVPPQERGNSKKADPANEPV